MTVGEIIPCINCRVVDVGVMGTFCSDRCRDEWRAYYRGMSSAEIVADARVRFAEEQRLRRMSGPKKKKKPAKPNEKRKPEVTPVNKAIAAAPENKSIDTAGEK